LANKLSFLVGFIFKEYLLQILSTKIHWEIWTQQAFCNTFKLISRLNIICIFCNGCLKDVLHTSLVKNASNLHQNIDFHWCISNQNLGQVNVRISKQSFRWLSLCLKYTIDLNLSNAGCFIFIQHFMNILFEKKMFKYSNPLWINLRLIFWDTTCILYETYFRHIVVLF
jgi:hypothetical protein